jgi:hypothetical protein
VYGLDKFMRFQYLHKKISDVENYSFLIDMNSDQEVL